MYFLHSCLFPLYIFVWTSFAGGGGGILLPKTAAIGVLRRALGALRAIEAIQWCNHEQFLVGCAQWVFCLAFSLLSCSSCLLASLSYIELPFCMHDDIPLDAFDSCSRLMIVDPIYEKNAIYERKWKTSSLIVVSRISPNIIHNLLRYSQRILLPCEERDLRLFGRHFRQLKIMVAVV